MLAILPNWAPRTVSGILDKQEHLGRMVNFKPHRQSYKNKRKIENPPDKSGGHRVQDVDINYNYIGILPASLLNDLINGTAA